MSTFSVAEAEERLPSLIERALAGEDVVITRDGKPLVELRPAPRQLDKQGVAAIDEWLISRRNQRKAISITSVELLNQIYESDD